MLSKNCNNLLSLHEKKITKPECSVKWEIPAKFILYKNFTYDVFL